MSGPMPKRMIVTIDHRESRISQRVESTTAEGVEQTVTFEFAIGSETTNTVQGIPVRTNARWEGQELLIESWMKTPARELHFKDYWSLSKNCLTLTMTHRDDDLAGQVSILEKLVKAV